MLIYFRIINWLQKLSNNKVIGGKKGEKRLLKANPLNRWQRGPSSIQELKIQNLKFGKKLGCFLAKTLSFPLAKCS